MCFKDCVAKRSVLESSNETKGVKKMIIKTPRDFTIRFDTLNVKLPDTKYRLVEAYIKLITFTCVAITVMYLYLELS